MNNLKELYENINILGKKDRCAMYTESMGSAICLVGIEHLSFLPKILIFS